MSIEEVYGISSQAKKDGKISEFSLQKEIGNQFNKIRTVSEDVCFVVCPHKVLSKMIEPWKCFQNKNESTMMNNILDFISEIKSNTVNNNANVYFYHYSFSNKVIEIANENEMKKKLFAEIGNEGDLLLSLSELFNEIDKKNSVNENKGRFLRIVLFTPKLSKAVKTSEIKNILASFVSSNKNYSSVVINFLFMEYDKFFSETVRREEEFMKLTDTLPKFFDNSLSESSQEINFLLSLYENKKFCFDKINEEISDNVNQSKENGELLDFIRTFDEKFEIVKEAHNAVQKDLKIMKNPSTRQNQKEIIRAKINDEVLSTGMIASISKGVKDAITEKVNGSLGEWLTEAKRKSRTINEEIGNIKEDISELNESHFWKKKIEFIEEQSEVISNMIRKVENIMDFVYYVEKKINDDANFLIQIK